MADSRLVESWTWFAFASLTFVWRCISRVIRLGGWRNFEMEDYCMALTFGFYTNVIVFVNIQQKHPSTNILPPTGIAGMSQAQINDRIYGSKITFTIEESMIMTQWGCKVCMCLLYYKLTAGLGLQRQVKFLMGCRGSKRQSSPESSASGFLSLSRQYLIDTTALHTQRASCGYFELKRRRPSKHDVRLDDTESESTENLAAKQPSPLKIWQTSEYGVNEHDAGEGHWDETEAQSVKRGRIGTKSTVVASRQLSGQ
ncbi:hypothetical protein V498_09610 [Pseudogymnoascus sp. VKM F-4517 (FW-2822)]|nr:hypothetical protein V498_09610 [Pseudogymnoascus sp. VKM F-4517 (FW-2822)]